MDIQNRKELYSFAGQRLENTPGYKKITLIFSSVIIGLSLLSALLSYALGLRIDQSGGLSNLGTRSILSALQTMLPIIQSAVVMCVELGYTAAMLRVARGQYVSPQTLRLGFDRFWVLLRFTLLKVLFFTGIALGSAYLGITIFLISPLSGDAMELLVPLVSEASVLDATVAIPEAIYNSVLIALIPAYVIVGILFCAAGIPLMYRLRMSNYLIIDKPAAGAIAALRESRKMMKGNCIKLFKMDLRLWWFYAATLAATLVGYGDQLLPLLGVELPFSAEGNYFLFYGIYWVVQFLIYYFLLPRVEVSYALCYDAIRPKEEPGGGVVLGNIFQM